MDESHETENADALTQAINALYDELLAGAWEPALRFALDLEHGIEGCNRRACRMAGRCSVNWKEGTPIDCGAGVPPEAIMTACALVDFGCRMTIRFLEDVAGPAQVEAVRAAARGFNRRSGATAPDAAGGEKPSRRRKLH